MKLWMTLIFFLFSFQGYSRAPEDNLTWKEAKARREQVKSVSYKLYFLLSKGDPKFKGTSTMEVELAHTRAPLFIDTMAGEIESVKINNKEIKNFVFKKGSLEIPAKALSPSMNIEVAFSTEYSKESHGFKKVVDPEDNEEYLYTDFEPYYAHWLFPSFDQPDLKATYEVTVDAPRDWKIVHNDLVETEERNGEIKTTKFKKTKPFSTYLFFLGAGPWEEWTDDLKGLPLVIHARKSMKKYVDAKNIFNTTKKGLEFYNDYFGYTYPFPKYGQIFVPDFAAGAMENPGAVTINEQRFLYRGEVTQTTLSNRDNLILHEMAHMWFGDLVTMKWWNDLWLNESFATYAANLAQERAMKSDFASIDFLETKIWGYWQDQLVTTHPIEAKIPDVRSAKGNFDGITYAKGASALKQLHFYVGEEGFKKGLQNYFKQYAFQNTIRKDFIDSIASASNVKLEKWTRSWLQSAGTHRVEIKMSCRDNKTSKLTLDQKKNKSGMLSPHKAKLGLYKKTEAGLVADKTIDVTYETSLTNVNEVKGSDCPDFILPNVDDKDYALFSLDEKSLMLAPLALKTLPDALSRYNIWSVLLQMVRDQKLAPKSMLNIALDALKDEKDEDLLGTILGSYSPLRDQYIYYLSVEERKEMAPLFEKVIWDRVQTSKNGSSLQMTFFDFYTGLVQTKTGLDNLASMLKGNGLPSGISLDADRRWALVKRLAVNNYSGIKKIIDEESKKDVTTTGKRYALVARVAIPELESKVKNLKDILRPGKIQFSDLREVSGWFFHPNSPELNKHFFKEYFQKISTLDWSSHDDYTSIYLRYLFPRDCTADEFTCFQFGQETHWPGQKELA